MRTATILVIFLVLPVLATAFVDPGETDTLRIGSTSCLPGRHCDVPVFFFNDENLYGLEIILSYEPDYLSIDSFSLIGSRLEGYSDPFVDFFQFKDNLLNYAFTPNPFSDDSIPPGTGLLGTLHFTVNPIAGGVSFPIECAPWPMDNGLFRSTIFAGTNTEPIEPFIVPGEVVIQEAPPSPDSIWVDTVSGIPGQTVAVNVYGYNVEYLSVINLALEISSDNLIYNQTTYSGTRGETAFTKQASPSGQQLLITLIFNEASPLPPGEGVLARIMFDVALEATEELVTIDSTTYASVQPTQLVLTPEEGGLAFTPYFTAGHVEIKSPTAIDDFETSVLPDQFALKQNVPNPFNPTTRIAFDLPQASEVRLDIYNILGQKVRTLVDQFMSAGTHEVMFDGHGDQNQILASGVYFYRIYAGEFRQSRKMTLVK